LLPSNLTVDDGSGVGRHFCISFGNSTVSPGRFYTVHRFRVLSSAPGAKMRSSNKYCRVDSVMGIGRFGVDLDPFPADHGKRNRWAVI
jgi:hypothetical protein